MKGVGMPNNTRGLHQLLPTTILRSVLVSQPRLLAFLREEEERERLEEIERLKPIGTSVGPYMEYRLKAEVGQTVKTEFGEYTVDNRAWIRTGHTLTQVGGAI